MNDSRLSIRQTFAAIGIHAERARQEIVSPRGEQSIKQPSAAMNFSSEPSKLEVDSSQAWHALGKGPNLEWSSAIYSQMDSVYLQLLAHKVDQGKRMADITNSRSAFADLARANMNTPSTVKYQIAAPGFNNVKLNFQPGSITTEIEPSQVDIQYNPRKPEITAQRGNLDIYLRQQNSISIEVTNYDLYK
ncbi:DUF6470 family protein [Paenibacillus sp. GCM10023252]|uniref:DUF6470 family protein n=1 Tax=Paenibacillus sp. GCM10023252 TaxID=3252649 RepID=UPI003618008E